MEGNILQLGYTCPPKFHNRSSSSTRTQLVGSLSLELDPLTAGRNGNESPDRVTTV